MRLSQIQRPADVAIKGFLDTDCTESIGYGSPSPMYVALRIALPSWSPS